MSKQLYVRYNRQSNEWFPIPASKVRERLAVSTMAKNFASQHRIDDLIEWLKGEDSRRVETESALYTYK